MENKKIRPSTIVIDEAYTPEYMTSTHWIGYRLNDDLVRIEQTGIATLGPEKIHGNSDWVKYFLQVVLDGSKFRPLLDLGKPKTGQLWVVRPSMWTVSAAPVSIFDADTAVNAGWSVNSCNTEWDRGEPKSEGDLLYQISFFMDIEVRDSDAFLYRVNYDFRAIGKLAQRPG